MTLGSRSHKMLPSSLYIMWPIQLQCLKLLRLTVRRRYIYKKKHYLTFGLDVKVTGNFAQYSLYHVTYLATYFEVATSNGLRGDTFTRNLMEIHGRTHDRPTLVLNMDGHMDARTTDRLWYEINYNIHVPVFLKKTASIIRNLFHNHLNNWWCVCEVQQQDHS